MSERVAIGSDHRGFPLKEALKTFLHGLGKDVLDAGTCSGDAVDYPVYAEKVAGSVSSGESVRGILVCGSGIGMSVAANKFPGVRAALCHDVRTAEMSRRHNDANILVLGETVGKDLALQMLKTWMETPFEGGRHQKRLDLIRAIERRHFKNQT